MRAPTLQTAVALRDESRRLRAEGDTLPMGSVQNIRAYQRVCLKRLAIRRSLRDLRREFPRRPA